jgi:phosphohistidine phosphatase
MKTLTVMRHAKSSWGDAGLNDFDRPLNARGRKAAAEIGKELRHRGIRFDAVIASPAMRVRETLTDLASGYGADFDVRFDPRIYEAMVDHLLTIVREISEDVSAPLLVGHNPGLQNLVLELAREDSNRRHHLEAKFPTAAVAILHLPARHWQDVETSSAEIAGLILPKELD